MPSPAQLTASIRREAELLGFFKVGVAPAGPLPMAGKFDAWLESGKNGEMGYMERQAAKRRDPGLVLDRARSILVLARNYYTGNVFSDDPLHGRVSRYAWGDDYHGVLRDDLDRLEKFVRREIPGARTLSYVDTGPVMEKVWGATSALGWMGKHTNLITLEQGSWFFIGIILLDVELEYDQASRDHCGTCTRCISACPTGAIVSPYVVDARLCISYLTIELRGKIPRALRPLIGNRIFGCDDCQEVCPWNRFAIRTEEVAFKPRDKSYNPALASLVDITSDEFNRRFCDSPIRRAGRNGFVRNVVVALGNSRSSAAAAPLARALDDSSPLVRAHAVWAMAQLDSAEARLHLESARLKESDRSVLEEFD
jgi:epoxyqueuosine reductase